jgi:hypothetical protein
MKRLKLPYLAVSMDIEGHQWILQMNLTIKSMFLSFQDEIAVSNGTHSYASLPYNILTARKLKAVLAILQLGYDVLFIDPDAVLWQNPLPYLFYRGVDYVHSLNTMTCDPRFIFLSVSST